MDPGEAMAEVLGRATGFAKGKGGSMHFLCSEMTPIERTSSVCERGRFCRRTRCWR
jgi:TPP-dependent pyruvate/acetoin dehydrogenase alpha subunit